VAPDNAAWMTSKTEAAEATDGQFAGFSGFEYSENDGPGAKGHINVINTAEYINALAPGVDLPYLFQWLKTAAPNGDGPVVASFNHPGRQQYDNWAGRDPEVTDIITLLEVINSDKNIHYDAFVNALDNGWKVSPVCGIDSHGFWGLDHATSRTFVLATEKTKTAILDAMKQRRTYAAMDQNIQCRYTVNGAIMGSTLNRPEVLSFEISISDPDADDPRDQITKIDIVKDGGVVVETHEPAPAAAVTWKPTIEDAESTYLFVRVWNAGGGDADRSDAAEPVAWLAPVWTGR
jgi:hypothetical protein